MRKNGFTIVEVVVVFLLILGITFLVLPASLDTTKQARFISKWTEKYSDLLYMFSVIQAQGDVVNKIKSVDGKDAKSKVVIDIIKPYMRLTTKVDSSYVQHYMNHDVVIKKGDKYSFDNFYNTAFNEIVGFKLINPNCKSKELCALLSVDVNGAERPNTFGYDIFVINILKNSIEPSGKEVEAEVMKNDCSKYGFGIYCSYYYLIGGRFD